MQVKTTSEGHPVAQNMFRDLQDVRTLMGHPEGKKMMGRFERLERARKKRQNKNGASGAPVLQRSESAEVRAEKAMQELLLDEGGAAGGDAQSSGHKKEQQAKKEQKKKQRKKKK